MGAVVVHVNVTPEIEQFGSDSVPVVPAGIVSEMTAPASSVEGPPFVRVIVYVVEVPATIEATPSVFVTTMSTAGSTIVDSESVSLPGTGSVVADVTWAVSV